MMFHLFGGRVECMTPFFAPSDLSTWRVATTAPCDDDTCRDCGGAVCDILDDTGELITRTGVQWVQYQACRAWLAKPQKFTLRIAAFAHEAWSFPTVDAYLARQSVAFGPPADEPEHPSRKKMQFAENMFLPEGLFTEGPVDMNRYATAIFAGTVERVDRLVNALTSAEFLRIRVLALPGPIDVVMEPGLCTELPTVGSILLTRAWFVGGPDVLPSPPKKSWIGRLFG